MSTTTIPKKQKHAQAPEQGAANPDSAAPKPERTVNPFRVDPQKGIYSLKETKAGIIETWLSSPFQVTACTRTQVNDSWGREVEFNDPDGDLHRITIQVQDLISDPKRALAMLVNEGLRINTSRPAQEALGRYIQLQNPKARKRCVSQVGWYGNVYVLPDQSFGADGGEQLVLHDASEAEYCAGTAGTLDDWIEHVGKLCVGNSRAVFATSAAFGGVLLNPAGEESGGIHFYAGTSKGKTTVQVVGGSVWGGGARTGYVRSWRSTANGVEAMAAMHNDGFLCLDEIAQIDPLQAVDIAYLLANGSGKNRMQKTLQAHRQISWRLLFTSSGEVTLTQHVQTMGRKTLGGQLIRLIDVPADAGRGLGVFENIHGAKDGGEFARQLKGAALKYYGTPIRAFLQAFVARQHELLDQVVHTRNRFSRELVPPGASGEVSRAADRFGLIAAAGELATFLGITGWRQGEAYDAAGRCFKDWLNARGTIGPSDEEAAVRQVIGFVQQHGRSRFQHECGDCDRPIINRAGFILTNQKTGRPEYFIFPEVFRRDVCAGYDPQFVAKALQKQAMLITQKGQHLTVRRRLPNMGSQRVYGIRLTEDLEAEDAN